MTSNFNLKAISRQTLGSADSRRARKEGNIPSVIHNKNGENQNILVNSREFEREYFKGNIQTTVVEIELDGKKISVIPHKIEIHPVTDRPIHIDFLPFAKGEKVKVKTKLKFTGRDKSPGIKRGGFLHIALRKIEVICNADQIPETIEIDISKLRVGAKIRSTDLNLPAGVALAEKNVLNIASILGRGAKSDEDKAADAAESSTAEGGEEETAEGDKKE